jgi:3'(2'), 5'-bisphosphate nucleotidase
MAHERDMMDDNAITALLSLVEEAGRAILRLGTEQLAVREKDDRSPVTMADHAAQQVIIEGLTHLFPAVPIISEECGVPPFAARRGWTACFLVDPLDGTKEFLAGGADYTVNVALIVDGHPFFGVVLAPRGDVLYYGGPEHGARVRRSGQDAAAIHVRPIDPRAMVAVASRSHGSQAVEQYLGRLPLKERINIGSSLKFCLVAEGKADIYPRFSPTSEWDTAAAHAVLLGAGGQVTDLYRKNLVYNKENLLNPSFLAYGDASCDWHAALDATLL